MTTAIFWRFLWKEYRVMRAFWISMAVLAVLAQLSLVAFPGLTHYPAGWTFSFALIFPALYAVACGATMFAAEKEDGTYEFLRSLPVTAWRLLTGKLAFAVASTALLICVLLLTGDRLQNGRTIEAATESLLWRMLGLAAIEGLAWGLFFSLILRRPLQAAVLAIAAASVCVQLLVRLLVPFSHWDDPSPYLTAVPYRAGIALLVLLGDLLIVPRWLATPKSPDRRWFRNAISAVKSAPAESLAAPRSAIFGRLVWQTWRQSRGMMLILGLAGGLAALASPLPNVVEGFLFKGGNARIAVIAATAALMGSCVFLADQEERRFRYFGEHAVEFRMIWLAKLLTWFAVLCIWAVIVHGRWFLTQGGSEFVTAARERLHLQAPSSAANRQILGWYDHLPPISLSVLLTVAGFACGQLGSMMLRSGILAAFVGVVSTLIIYAWAQLIQFFEISWLWSLCPIPLLFLLATWLRTPDWILERNTWRGWLRIAAALSVLLASLVVGVSLYRVYQIPNVSPGFSPDEYASSTKPSKAAEETAEMFVKAAYLLKESRTPSSFDNSERPPNAGDLEFLRLNSEALAAVLKAADRPECSFDGVRDSRLQEKSSALAHLLSVSARQLEADRKLDEAWGRWLATLRFESQVRDSFAPWTYHQLLLWAAQPGQTRERIVSAIKQLKQFETTLRTPADEAKSQYLWVRRAVTGGPRAISEVIQSHADPTTVFWVIPWSMVPCERSRALRLLNVVTASDLQLFESVGQSLRDGTPVTTVLPPLGSDFLPRPQYEEVAWLRTTPLLKAFYNPPLDYQVWNWIREETTRRATHVIMAIEAWKVDHKGDLPEHLSQLVGAYLDKLPLDPYSGTQFYYVRKGIPPPSVAMAPTVAVNASPAVADSYAPVFSGPTESSLWLALPKQPFIWSPGEWVQIETPPDIAVDPRVAEHERLPRNPYNVRAWAGGDHWRVPLDEYDVWLSGQYFEIP